MYLLLPYMRAGGFDFAITSLLASISGRVEQPISISSVAGFILHFISIIHGVAYGVFIVFYFFSTRLSRIHTFPLHAGAMVDSRHRAQYGPLLQAEQSISITGR